MTPSNPPPSGPEPREPVSAPTPAEIPGLAQEAVVGALLAGAPHHPDQLAGLPPDTSAPPVPAAHDRGDDPAHPAHPADGSSPGAAQGGDGLAALPTLPDAAPAPTADPSSDAAANGFAGHVFVTAPTIDPGAPIFGSAEPLFHPSDPSPFGASSFASVAPLLPHSIIPQDHELFIPPASHALPPIVSAPVVPAPVVSAPVVSAPAAVAPPPVAPEPTHPAPLPDGHISGGSNDTITGVGADDVITISGVGVGVQILPNISISPNIGVLPSPPPPGFQPDHAVTIEPLAGGGYTFAEDGTTVALSAGQTFANGSGLTVGVDAHGAVLIAANGALSLAGTVNGDLSIITNGAVSESGPLSVAGGLTISENLGAGAITVTGGGVLTITNTGVVTNTGVTNTGGSITVAGAVSLTMTAESITDHGAIVMLGAGYSAAELHAAQSVIVLPPHGHG